MKITVENHYSGQEQVFEGGEDDIRRNLVASYPILREVSDALGFWNLLEWLGSCQAYSVGVDADSEHLDRWLEEAGPETEVHREFEKPTELPPGIESVDKLPTGIREMWEFPEEGDE